MNPRPNVIWILGDQHRGQALSGMGDPNVQTPNIDRFSAPGMAVAGCPLCSPFRGSLLTSQYPHLCVPGHDVPMPDGMPTVATVFHEHGYRTAWFGKWHVDGDTNRPAGARPAMQTVARHRRGGFDSWIGYENNNAQYDSWVHGHDWHGTEVAHRQLPGYETDELTNWLLRYLKETQKDALENAFPQPFFACLSVQPPHSPYVAPEEWRKRHTADTIRLRPNVPNIPRVTDAARRDLAGYYAMIENLDWNVGRICEMLKKLGLAENTVLVFFSDHGDMHGSHGRILKCCPHEESVRIPFHISFADHSDRISFADDWRPTLVNHVDIAPTTLGLCGIDPPDWMKGIDYSGHYLPQRPLPENEPQSAFIQLVDPGWTNRLACDRERPWRGIVTDDGWKYAVLEGQPWLMFNLNEDPYEQANLALDGRFSKKRRDLQDRLQQWLDRTGDTFSLPDIPVQ